MTVRTDDGSATIAAATVDSGDCRIDWCSGERLPDGGVAPCASLTVHATSSCQLSFVSTTGDRQQASIRVSASTLPPLRCREREMVYEIPRTDITPPSITLHFAVPATDAGRDWRDELGQRQASRIAVARASRALALASRVKALTV